MDGVDGNEYYDDSVDDNNGVANGNNNVDNLVGVCDDSNADDL